MSISDNNPAMPLASVTISLYPGAKLNIQSQGMMTPDILQAVLLQTLLIVSQQVVQQVSSSLVLAGGAVPRADG